MGAKLVEELSTTVSDQNKTAYAEPALPAVIGKLTGLAEEILCMSAANAALGARRTDRYGQVSTRFRTVGLRHAAEVLLNRAAALSLKDESLTNPECCREPQS